jgi:hypothetical protein
MPLIFNSVKTFVEQIGRRRAHKSKGTELDTMQCVYTGPTALVSKFIPLDGTPHGEFPFMISTGWDTKIGPASQSELIVDYVGKFQVGQVLENFSYHEGSISWSTYVGPVSRVIVPRGVVSVPYQAPSVANPNPQTVFIIQEVLDTSYMTKSYVCRFTAKTCTHSIVSRSPGGAPSGGAAITAQTTFTTGASLSKNLFGLVSATLNFEEHDDESVTDLGNGWFEVSVTSTMLPVIDSTVNTSQG